MNSPRPAWTEQVTAAGAPYLVTHWTNLNAGHSWVLQTAPDLAAWTSVSTHWGANVTVIRPIVAPTEYLRLIAGP